MSRTPISDNAAFRVSDCLFESEKEALVIPLDLAHKLENLLNLANARVKKLEEAGDALYNAETCCDYNVDVRYEWRKITNKL